MRWLAGYHTSSGEHHDNIRPSWAEARAVMVDELDQRLMGYLRSPEGHETQIAELEATLGDFGGLDEGDEVAADADGLTFVLVPASTAIVRDVVEVVALDSLAGFDEAKAARR